MIKEQIERNRNIKVNTRELEKLKSEFPHYFDEEGNFKINQFKEMLQAEEVKLNKEGYGLNFLGKSYAKYESALETETVITPDTEHNQSPENKESENLYITGDNIDALKHLLNSYSNKIKCIYIDPPYNTGSDSFVYPDDFSFKADELAQKIGIEVEEAEKILNLTGKSTHSAWLTFMYPRLVLARDLLTDDGVIFISIDDNELYNLTMICNEIFGDENFIANSIVASNSSKNNSNYIAVNHEYILCYSKNINFVNTGWKVEKNQIKEYEKRTNQLLKMGLSSDEIHEELLELVKYPRFYDFDHYTYADKKGIYRTDNSGGVENGNFNTDIIHPITAKVTAKPSGGWRYTEDTIKKMIDNNMIHFGKDEKIIPTVKRYLNDYTEQVPKSTLYFDSQSSTKWLKNNNLPFDFPKSVDLIKHILSYVSDKDSIILDFFSGSSTTAHSVMSLNAEDQGNRKYIMVQIPEPISENQKAFKEGFSTIDDIGRLRIKRAADKIKTEKEADIDYGYKLYYLNNIPNNTLHSLEDFIPNEKSQLLPIEFTTDAYIFNGENGINTILTTYLNQDGYGLGIEVENYQLDTYSAKICMNSMYIIDEGLSSNDVMNLIHDLETSVLNINRVVIYAHSINFSVLHELRNNLKNLKNSKTVQLIERY